MWRLTSPWLSCDATSHHTLRHYIFVNICLIDKRKNTCLIIFDNLQNHVNGMNYAKCGLYGCYFTFWKINKHNFFFTLTKNSWWNIITVSIANNYIIAFYFQILYQLFQIYLKIELCTFEIYPSLDLKQNSKYSITCTKEL